jgi:hypothetical protein
MAGDVRTGRTEVDHYNGYLIELAEGTPCPLNAAVHALLKRVERERLCPHPALLDGLWPQPNAAARISPKQAPAVDSPLRSG